MHRRWFRGLRPRLTLSYVLFFTVLLILVGLLFRETLRNIYKNQAQDLLSEEWGAIRGYLRIERGKPFWFYDRHDPDESLIVERLRHVYLLTDSNGVIKEVSPVYRSLGIETPERIKQALKTNSPTWTIRETDAGVPYIIRSGTLLEENRRYYLAMGRSLAESERVVDQFTRNYFVLMPLMILAGSLFGWFVAKRALEPVNNIANTAERITGSNLTAHIPRRGAEDELDRLIDAFNLMIERLNTQFTQTRQFSTDVSHELRTPLTAIRGQLEVAMFAAENVEQYREAIVNALQDVDRLSQTIRALLLLSQAESGQLALQRQPLDLAGVVADIVEQFQIPADEARLRLTHDLPGSCPIYADRVQIDRLISNLLSNAVKYTPEGGSIHVRVACHGHEAELSVADTGVGIPADHLPHIFDRFYRVPGKDLHPERGLGLGLSFVAWIVKAHGGTIDVRSKTGEGTAFHIRLPVARGETVHADSPAAAHRLE